MGENSSASESLTYKDVSILSKFISEQGKILPRRITGLTSREQKRITKLVKQARIAALFPFVIGKS
jgi:small subunit ribosomal protein S18